MDTRMILTYVMVDLFCIIMAMAMGFYINLDFGNESEVKALRYSLISYCGFLIFGLIWLLMENNYLPLLVPVIWIANIVSLFCLSAIGFFWFVFADMRLNKRTMTKNRFLLSALPLIVAGVMLVLSPLTGWAFTVSSSGVYQHGPFFTFFSLLGYVYDIAVLVISIVSTVKEKRRETRRQYVVIGIFILFPMIAGILQIKYSGTPILAPAIITVFFLVFINIQSAQIYNDALTGLNNRRRTNQYIENQLADVSVKNPMVIYVADVDQFKSINDKYGHIVGDKALSLVAKALIKLGTYQHIFVARYGGDEFIVVAKNQYAINPANIVNELQKIVKEESLRAMIEYNLSISVGYAVITDNHLSLEQAINQADQNLYFVKRKL